MRFQTKVMLFIGSLLGIGLYKTFFFIIVPIMAGGVGEGAVPLSIAYAAILKISQDATFAQVSPRIFGAITVTLAAILLRAFS